MFSQILTSSYTATKLHTCSRIYKSTAAIALLVRMTALIMACIPAGAPLIVTGTKHTEEFCCMILYNAIKYTQS